MIPLLQEQSENGEDAIRRSVGENNFLIAPILRMWLPHASNF
jgi:hypothetical protein